MYSAGSRVAAYGILAVCFLLQPCFAQIELGSSRFDAYGNVRPGLPDRRALSPVTFQSDLQRQALQGYLLQGRRANQRGGLVTFALPGDPLLVSQPPVAATLLPRARVPLSKRRAFEQYGGFGERSNRHQPADFGTLLQRRYSLLEATSFNAPVHRAMWGAAARGIASPLAERTLSRAPVALEPVLDGRALEEHLQLGVAFSLHRLHSEGWRWFREGAYRRAARLFESAAVLQEGDGESRLGELFCYLSVGAIRTSFAALDELSLRESNPFVYELSLTDRYAGPAHARQARVRSQQYAQAHGDHPQAVALHVLVLWYLDERHEAILTADSAADVLRGTAYADWPAKMRTAQAARARADKEP